MAYGSIEGRVYYDADYNGQYDIGTDTPAHDLKVVATSTKLGVTDTHTTTTDADGAYRFDGLRFADYEIRVDHPGSAEKQEFSAGNDFHYYEREDAASYFSNSGNLVALSDENGKQTAKGVDVPLWEPHTVTFIVDPARASLSDSNAPSVIFSPVWHGSKIDPPQIYPNSGFVVVEDHKWLPVNGETFGFDNVTATGTFKANVVPNNSNYTVNYLEKDTNKVLQEPKAGEYKELGAIVKAADEEIKIDGYTYAGADTETLTITTGENVINLYYTKRDPLEGKKAIIIGTGKNEITFYYTPIFYTVTFDSNGGSTVTPQRVSVRYNTAVDRPVNPTRSGYTFMGWFMNGAVYDFTALVRSDITLVASWTANRIIFPFTPTPTPTPVNPTPTPTPDGTTIDDQNVPLAGAVGLNNTDHFAYIVGYENDTVRPTANISRAEVAAIFFRLMTEEFRIANWSTENAFSDVKASDWYNNAVSTCVKAGIIKGYEDGTFRPGQSITRAEFAAIAARFLGPDANDEGVGDFADTANKWYSADVRKAAKAGWISGMGGNRFEPDAKISRAQVMSIVNRMLDRTPDADHMLPGMKTWTDNPEGTWYYVDVQEATNGHDYTRDETNIETWTAIQAKKNWVEIEAEWAANNGASAPKNDTQPIEADSEAK